MKISIRLLLAGSLVLGLACHSYEFHPKYGEGEIDLFDDLFTVSVGEDGQHVVAAGYWGTVYVSEDGGETWDKAESGTKRLIYDISIADGHKGWAVGQTGIILRTEDGGRTWSKQESPKEATATNLFAVHAVDGNTAWAVGEWGSRLFTDDGGASWQDFSLTIDETHPQFVWLAPAEQDRVRRGEAVFEDVTLNDVTCRPGPSKSCWMIGEFGYVFYSETLGQSWERAAIEQGARIEPIELPYNSIELTEEHAAALERFASQIADEQHLNVAINPVASDREIQDFGMGEDPTDFFEILEARTNEVKAVVEEAGILQDRIRLRGSPPWDYEDFLEDDPEFLVRYFDSRRREKSGLEVDIAQNPYLFSIRFRDEQHGLISGLGGLVLKSDDGGRNWAYHNIDRKQALFAVQPMAKDSIAIGEKGLLRVSSDGGVSWSAPGKGFPTIFTFMRDLGFAADETTGFIVGQSGMVLKSLDAGKTWSQVLPPEDRRKG